MPNDTAIIHLLYAILSQKCLKDIDWNKVAHHPILSEEKITNGHAARMRYSRFNKQMDGTSGIVRNPRPRKPRVEKPSSSSNTKAKPSPRKGGGKGKNHSQKEEEDASGDGKIKLEGSSRQGTAESDLPLSVKREPGLAHAVSSSEPTPRTLPSTPSSERYRESASPNPARFESPARFDGADMNEMGYSFGMNGHGNSDLPSGMYSSQPMMSGGLGGGYGMGGMVNGGMMGMRDPYEDPWTGHHGLGGYAHAQTGIQERAMMGERVHVKTEGRWEDGYRQFE